MMNDTRLKYIFFIFSAILLILMLSLCRNAGITCDEVLHYNHSVTVYNYFASHGADQSALNTPVTNLKYYGQSYDNIVTIFIRWFNIDDVYGFRHLMSSFAGWLAILITALFAVWLADYKAGILVLFLFAISPTFIGHTQNNLKDIPFALAYISGIFFMLKLLVSGKTNSFRDLILLSGSIAFAISIRAGGLILLCYLFFFLVVIYAFKYFTDHKFDPCEVKSKFYWFCGVSGISWFLSIILWPFAIKGPIMNVIESYGVMAHFPATFRQIFEGKVEWSDFMPWYYLPKSMVITVPVLVMTGLLLFVVFVLKKIDPEKKLLLGCLIFTIVFPLVFVVYEKSNVYSSWRQFLFVYPGLVLLASIGLSRFYEVIRSRYLKWGMAIIIILLSLHPLKFMIRNPQFYYLYYNQFVGGLKGAYSNYETDYYYQSQTEASRWLIDYINNRQDNRQIKVMANYTVDWQFRSHPEIKTFYLRYEERSQSDWDYAIITNRYISPFQLRNKIWPPKNSIHLIFADSVPVCAVLERKSKDDLAGYKSLTDEKYDEAIDHFQKALKIDADDEMIFFNFAAALFRDGQYQKADSILKVGLKVSPDSELILMYLGNIARSQNKNEEAIGYYEKVINVNRKYFEAYVGLSGLLKAKDVYKARALLEKCLSMNPEYKPAIVALADTYRDTDPEIARKYDELASTIK
jgi:tetratricopeptide (TPR) repeat protein